MKKVYVVTSGSYSDFGIDSIFSSLELAEEYIRRKNQGESYSHVNDDVQEYDLDPDITIPKSPHKFKYFYFGEMYRNGDIIPPVKKDFHYDVYNPDSRQEEYYLLQDSHFSPEEHIFKNYYKLHFTVNADSEDHAIKKAIEKRQYLLRTNNWPEFADRLKGRRRVDVTRNYDNPIVFV